MTSPSPSPLLPAAAYERARGHAMAAASLLDDGSVPSWTAVDHIVRGFAELAVAAGIGPSEPDGAAQAKPVTAEGSGLTPEVITAIKAGDVTWISTPAQVATMLHALAGPTDAEAAAGAAAEVVAEGADVATVREGSLALSDAVARAAAEHFAPEAARSERNDLWRKIAMVVIVAIPVLVLLVLTSPSHREGPWHGQYFDNMEFQGEPEVRRDGDIKFEWKRLGPSPRLPEDEFSARWDTCMVLDEDLSVAFQLISDDGSRLFVDGTQVIDNWGRHGKRSRGGELPLSAGVHHLRVEYFDARHAARVELKASLRGELPDSIPVRILRYPGEDFDPDDPCAAIGVGESP